LQGIATSAAEKRPKNEAVWQENGGFEQRILHIFSVFCNCSRIILAHLLARKQFALIRAIIKKDAQKPMEGLCFLEVVVNSAHEHRNDFGPEQKRNAATALASALIRPQSDLVGTGGS
jgi:hypothetical protein